MGFYIKYDDIRALMDTTQGQIGAWRGQLDDVAARLTDIKNQSGFQGKAAESTKSYISEVHMEILKSFEIVFQGYLSHLAMYSSGYYSAVDDNRDALLREDVLEDLKSQYGSKQSQINSLSSDLSSTFNNISDLVYLNPNGMYPINDRYACMNNQYQTLIDNVKSYELTNEDQLADTESAIGNLISYINEYANATSGRGSQYVAGSYTGSKLYEGLEFSMSGVTAYVQANKDAIDEANRHEIEVRLQIYNTQLENRNSDLNEFEILSEDSMIANGLKLVKMCAEVTDDYVFNSYELLVNFIKSKPALDGMKIVERDGYWYIKGFYGERKNIDGVKEIKAPKYSIGSDAFKQSKLNRFNPSGTNSLKNIKKFTSNIMDTDIWEDSFEKFGIKEIYKFKSKDVLGNIGKVVGYSAIAIDTGSDIYNDVINGASESKIVADTVVDVSKGLAVMAIATGCAEIGGAIGLAIPIPVVGPLVGYAVGFGVGLGVNWAYNEVIDGVEIGGKTVAGWASYGLEKGIDATVDVATKAKKTIENAVENTAKSVNKSLEAAKEMVGGAFSGFGKFVFG